MFYLLTQIIQMKILYNNNDLNEALNNVSKIGFVPTMGSLHKGHVSLIKKAKRESGKIIVSIFVNRTQFNNKEDFIKYPRNNAKDLSLLEKFKVNYVYIPKKEQVFTSSKKLIKTLKTKDKILCAKYRKGHFEGVLNVMDRLTDLIKPNKIFMGEKDFQQLFLVKKYIEKKYKCKIISCKTIRNKNKLALSSRNLRLSRKSLKKAEEISKDLIFFKNNLNRFKDVKEKIMIKKNQMSKLYNIKIEYLELRNKKDLKIINKIKNSKLFIAYYLDKIRLIDNF